MSTRIKARNLFKIDTPPQFSPSAKARAHSHGGFCAKPIVFSKPLLFFFIV